MDAVAANAGAVLAGGWRNLTARTIDGEVEIIGGVPPQRDLELAAPADRRPWIGIFRMLGRRLRGRSRRRCVRGRRRHAIGDTGNIQLGIMDAVLERVALRHRMIARA
jgi:hypothetical protein